MDTEGMLKELEDRTAQIIKETVDSMNCINLLRDCVKEYHDAFDTLNDIPEILVRLAPYSWSKTIYITIPHDPVLVNEVWETFKNLPNIKIEMPLKTDSFGNLTFYITLGIDKPYADRVGLTLDTNYRYEGSTCVRQKIGTRMVTKEEDVYEIVCKEGAAEGLGNNGQEDNSD